MQNSTGASAVTSDDSIIKDAKRAREGEKASPEEPKRQKRPPPVADPSDGSTESTANADISATTRERSTEKLSDRKAAVTAALSKAEQNKDEQSASAEASQAASARPVGEETKGRVATTTDSSASDDEKDKPTSNRDKEGEKAESNTTKKQGVEEREVVEPELGEGAKEPTSEDDQDTPKDTKKTKTMDEVLSEKNFLSFPERLMSIIADEQYKKALWWNPDGTAFCIHPKRFTEQVLKKFFQGTKFESFTRKLNRWGFKRILDDFFPSDTVAYKHDLFKKEEPKLLKQMNGGKKKDQKKTQAGRANQSSYQNLGSLYDPSSLARTAGLSQTNSLSHEMLRREILGQQPLQQGGISDQLLGGQSTAVEQLLAHHRLQQLQQQALLGNSLRQQAGVADQLLADRLRSAQLAGTGGGGLSLVDQLLLRHANGPSMSSDQLLASLRLQQQLQQLGGGADQMLGLQTTEQLLAAQLRQQQQLGMTDPLLGRGVDQEMVARELRLRSMQQQLGGNAQLDLTPSLAGSQGGLSGAAQGTRQQIDQRLLELQLLREQQQRNLSGSGRGSSK